MKQVNYPTTHPLMSEWLRVGWDILIPETESDVKEVVQLGYEKSTILLNVWYRRNNNEVPQT